MRYAHYFKVRQGRSGLCVPSDCSKKDIQTIVDNGKIIIININDDDNHLNLSFKVLKIDKIIFQVDTCQSTDDIKHYSPLQLMILIIFGLIATIIILATIIERLRWTNENSLTTMILKKLSIKQNIYQLLRLNTDSADNLASLNGIRVLTMFWLVYGHAYLLSVKEAFRSSTHFIKSLFDMKMYFLFNAWPAVDIFFILSALLHSYHVFKRLQSNDEINILKIVCNRIARLWPSLWFIVAFVFLIPNLGQGPLWSEIMEQQVNGCYENWWMVITFTANLRNDNNLCQIHTWYLSADVQLFLLSFIFIILIYK